SAAVAATSNPQPAATPVSATVQPASAAAPAGQPKQGGTLITEKLGDAANLDGHYWSPNGGLHVWLAYDTLARYDQNLTPQPQLAESWDVTPDLKQVTLHLRQGVTYHSGREFTSDDVVWNLQR